MNHSLMRIRNVATLELVPDRTARRVIAVTAFVVATALAAQVRVPIPMTPVPLTLQTMLVLLSGALLGARLGAASQLAYLALGIAGAPVFAGGAFGLAYLLGPTGGYLLAFPAAAFVVGALARPGEGRGMLDALRLVAALAAGSLVMLVSGAAWLAALTGDLAGAVVLGIMPFLMGDVIKVSLAALIAWRGRRRTLGLL